MTQHDNLNTRTYFSASELLWNFYLRDTNRFTFWSSLMLRAYKSLQTHLDAFNGFYAFYQRVGIFKYTWTGNWTHDLRLGCQGHIWVYWERHIRSPVFLNFKSGDVILIHQLFKNYPTTASEVNDFVPQRIRMCTSRNKFLQLYCLRIWHTFFNIL